MWRISTRSLRDQFTVLPMPDEVIKMLDAMAEKDGITRSTNLFEKPNPRDSDTRDDNDRPPQLIENDESDDKDDLIVGGPMMKAIPPDKRSEGFNNVKIEDVDEDEDEEDYLKDNETDVPVERDLRTNEERTNGNVPEPQDDWVRRSVRIARQTGLVIETGKVKSTACRNPRMVGTLSKRLTEQDSNPARRAISRELESRKRYHDTEYAFKMSVKAAMRDRPKSATDARQASVARCSPAEPDQITTKSNHKIVHVSEG
jgi:hypothetical protein